MKWIKSRGDFRQPKIYTTTPEDKKEFNIPSWMVWLIFIVIVFGIIGWFLFFSDYFIVRSIEIFGSLNSAVKSEIEQLKGKNIILLSLGNSEQELAKKQTSIKDLEIYRGIPDTLRVEVEVREPKISWQTTNQTYYIDDKGIVFTLPQEYDFSEEQRNNLINIKDIKSVQIKEGTQILTREFIDYITQIKDNFGSYSGAKIQQIEIEETTFQIKVVADKNFYVLFDVTRDVKPQLESLKKIIKEHITDIKEYIDMRVEGKAFYK